MFNSSNADSTPFCLSQGTIFTGVKCICRMKTHCSTSEKIHCKKIIIMFWNQTRVNPSHAISFLWDFLILWHQHLDFIGLLVTVPFWLQIILDTTNYLFSTPCTSQSTLSTYAIMVYLQCTIYSNTLSCWGVYHEYSHTQICTFSVLHD